MSGKKNQQRDKMIPKNIAREVVKAKVPEVLDKEEWILMPLVVTLMGSDMSKLQMNVIMNIIDHISNKLRAVLNHEVEEGKELSLFADQEINEDNSVNLQMYLKDFDVQRGNYPKLVNALRMLAAVPVELPFKSTSGRKYKKYTNFCSVYIPEDVSRNKYCIVSFQQEVAERVIKLDMGHHYIGKNISYSTKTKYSERIYWLISGHKDLGGVTISNRDLRKILGIEKKYPNFANVEAKILKPSMEELHEMAEAGNCDCYFEYTPIYNNGKSYGQSQPDAIEFSIFSGKANLDKQLDRSFQTSVQLFKEQLINKLFLNPSMADTLSEYVTSENIDECFRKINFLSALFEEDVEKNEIKNKSAYVLKSFMTFFRKEVNSAVPAEDLQPKQPQVWLDCLEVLRLRLSAEDFEESFGKVVKSNYKPAIKTLTLYVTSDDVKNLLTTKYKDILKEILQQKLGKGLLDIKVTD